MGEHHNVFVSHRHEDDALVSSLANLLAGKNVTLRDSSITNDVPNKASNEAYIKGQILAPNIRWAGKLIVLITPDTKNHPWVDWEIQYAERQGKQIIGVWAPGSAGCDVPTSLEQHADALTGWNSASITRALNGYQIWMNANGNARGLQTINRIGC